MQAKKLVSVVLPVYNGAAFVEQAICSIQEQTYPNWELIILDDGSQDASLAVCQSLATNDARLHVFSNPKNLGLAPTMNRLMQFASGEYIAVQEQDDVSSPDRLASEVDLLERMSAVGLVSGIAEWINDCGEVFALFPGILQRGEQYPQTQVEMVRYLYTEQCKVVNAGCMFRRAVLDFSPEPFDEEARMSIDWQFFIHVAHHWKIYGLPQVVVRMQRGTKHDHLTAKKKLQFEQAHRCIRKVYQAYHKNDASPINLKLYYRAMSTQYMLEGRSYSRFKGLLKLFQALLYDPSNRRAWSSIFEISSRGLAKLTN
jgi:glycosyltransferase involved in cell wall biosynthesis